jgi:hypothetical protein
MFVSGFVIRQCHEMRVNPVFRIKPRIAPVNLSS